MGFGYYESCWIQDVQNRVFSTLGQPNWLAALLVALIPITWFLSLKNKFIFLFSLVFFVTLLFTKSRSGLLAFGIESVIFWGYIFWKERFKFFKEFIFIFLSFSFLAFVFNPSLVTRNLPETASNGPALETGGTESGTIRKYVWLGALNIFRNYPILGTGPETFAFAFPKFKPVEHNLTSEWDFLYNKAHNEYLNYLANTGILGLLSYLLIIVFSVLQITNYSKYSNFKNYLEQLGKLDQLEIGLLSGFVAILVTNFFGFSVVPTSLLFFLFPAVAAISHMPDAVWVKLQKITLNQKLIIFAVLFMAYSILHITYSYWKADIHYNKAKNYNKENNTNEAINEIIKALKISPNEPLYIAELSLIDKDVDLATKALDLNPYNQNIRNILISNLNSRSRENEDYLLVAEQIAETGTQVAPMNPKIFYRLAILNLKNNKLEEGIINLEKAVTLKPNYKEGRFALGLTYIDSKDYQKAKENLEYILQNIDPNDELTKKYLEQAISASQ